MIQINMHLTNLEITPLYLNYDFLHLTYRYWDKRSR